MDSLSRLGVSLAFVVLVVTCTGVGSAEEPDTERYLKRSLCNTFGGCGGRFHGDMHFTGRSFSDKQLPLAPQVRPPYMVGYPTMPPVSHSPAKLPVEDSRDLPAWTRKYVNAI